MNLAAIAQQCNGAHRDQHGWRAKCPVHNGQSDTSLSLWEHDGQIWVKCWAECDYRTVLAALDLTRAPTERTPEVIYSYHTADGHLSFQVYRLSGKQFRQRQPDPTHPGKWLYNVKNVMPILYRLPEVKRAVQAMTPIYIVEGEKDVETLRSHGLVATCNAGGAKKWRASHTEDLYNAICIVLHDNDAPGRDHAAMVVRALEHVAKRVISVDLPGLPEHGDVTDWLQVHAFAEFEALVKAGLSPLTSGMIDEMSATELLKQHFKPLEWFAEGLLHEGMLLFGGKSKRGKSWIMLNLAASLAIGGVAFGYYAVPEPVKVLYCALEDGPRRTQRRLRMLDPLGEADYVNLKFAFKMPPLEDGGIEYLTQHILAGYKVIVVDVMAHVEKAGKNGLRDYHEVYKTFAPIQELRSKHSFALVMITHLRKAESEEVFNDLHGSVAYQGTQDALWVLERKQGMDTANLHMRDKDAEDKVVELKFDGMSLWSFVGEGEEYVSSKKQGEIVEVMREEGKPLTIKELMLMLGIPQTDYETFRKRVLRMAAEGIVVRLDRGKYGLIHRHNFDESF